MLKKQSCSLLVIFFLLTFQWKLEAQVITSIPEIPQSDASVIITFHADLGDKGLNGFTGLVYAHTGVITDQSKSDSDWKYVVAEWSVNTDKCKLTSVGSNQFQLKIEPSIHEFYNVPQNEKILKLAFVFRSADGSKTGRDIGGKDILTPVYENKLQVSIINKTSIYLLSDPSEKIHIKASALQHDSIVLYQDLIRIGSTVETNISDTITTPLSGKTLIIAQAYKGLESISDTLVIYIVGTTQSEIRPNGMKQGVHFTESGKSTFVLFAPYKKFIYLLGDFNNWQPEEKWLMKKDSDFFWIQANLTSGKEYAYQYLIDGDLRIADPYAEKVLDPSNDQFIPATVYPELIQYPFSKTTEIVSVIQPNAPSYQWNSKSFRPVEPKNLIIYELLIRDFSEKGSFQSIIDSLDYIKSLGVNAIEPMPFNEFEGNDSWGYNPSFYFAPDKAYGTKNDLKKLIDNCHQKGIAVIMDIVLNHSYSQSSFAQMYLDGGKPSLQNPWYNRNHNMQNPAAQWGYDFNHESIHTQQLVDSICSFWMSEYRIDGFRFDFTKGFTNKTYGATSWASEYDAGRIKILKRIVSEIRKRNPNAIIIFEHLSDFNEEKELADYGILLWRNQNWNYAQAAMGYNDQWDFSGISYKYSGFGNESLVGYMESHDEERIAYKCKTWGNSNLDYNTTLKETYTRRLLLNNMFFLTVPGPKMIWQFGELAYDISIDQGGRLGRKPIKWEYFQDPDRKRLYDLVSLINHWRVAEPVFGTTDFTTSFNGIIKSITLNHPDNIVFIVGNFDIQPKETTITFPSVGKWYDYFSNDSTTFDTPSQTMILKAGEFKMYSTQKINPWIDLKIDTLTGLNNGKVINIYPNPFLDQIKFESSKNIVSVYLWETTGSLIFKKESDAITSIQTDQLYKGIYLLKIKTADGHIETFKIVKT